VRRVWDDGTTTATLHTPHLITSETELRAILGEPTPGARDKIADRLNHLTRQFIERSSFVLVGTAHPERGLDVSPKGDPAGFVRVLDDRTLLLPDRPGNRLADSLTNLLADDRIALLFLIPGIGDTFRVNGHAAITDDAELLAPSAVEGRAPRLGLLVEVVEAYTHCSKSIIRSGLWDAGGQITRAELPSSGEILAELTDGRVDAETYDSERAARYARREGLY
jgi:uncharacterized protein